MMTSNHKMRGPSKRPLLQMNFRVENLVPHQVVTKTVLILRETEATEIIQIVLCVHYDMFWLVTWIQMVPLEAHADGMPT